MINTVEVINMINEELNELTQAKHPSNQILELMLKNLGAMSPQLRDDTIYYGFRKILRNNMI